ncbi:MAG: outer membrane lipoprotein-sorting protein [Polaribacter sp.]|jgi:outer membrane lipoprotein-sorting protein|tara:strand:+ start:1821 stop:2477 length:657 start_codon:yes stop_codon:yes gene_type:complete
MKKTGLLFLSLFITTVSFSQTDEQAKSLLDEVSTKMGSYKNMYIGFSQTLSNEDAGIKEGDEPPIRGKINLQGEKYSLNYLGNQFIYDGKKLHIINHDEKEISISEGDLGGDDGFIYPSKLLTFYKEGYSLQMGKQQNIKGRNIQLVTLNPIDSNSEIVKVELAIDAKTKHIYKLIQTGANASKTTFTITEFKKNENLSQDFFTFNKSKYLSKNYTID